MSQTFENAGWLQRFLRWLFGAPFQELPPEIGDPVPSELRVFEYHAEQARQHPRGKISTSRPVHPEQTKPVQQDESLERQ
jgi:hypothetical protein